LDWKLHLTCSEKYLLVVISGLQSGKKGNQTGENGELLEKY
jgi:hypothetical protein